MVGLQFLTASFTTDTWLYLLHSISHHELTRQIFEADRGVQPEQRLCMQPVC